MTEHTSGPWEWKWGDLCSSAEDMPVLTIIGAGYGDEHIAGNEADKALIKAAPELLAACEAIWGAMQAGNTFIGAHDDDLSQWDRAWDAVRAAIAKARGE